MSKISLSVASLASLKVINHIIDRVSCLNVNVIMKLKQLQEYPTAQHGIWGLAIFVSLIFYPFVITYSSNTEMEKPEEASHVAGVLGSKIHQNTNNGDNWNFYFYCVLLQKEDTTLKKQRSFQKNIYKLTDLSMFIGSTSAKLAPTLTRSRRMPLAKSSVRKFIGKHLKFIKIQVGSIKCVTFLISKQVHDFDTFHRSPFSHNPENNKNFMFLLFPNSF